MPLLSVWVVMACYMAKLTFTLPNQWQLKTEKSMCSERSLISRQPPSSSSRALDVLLYFILHFTCFCGKHPQKFRVGSYSKALSGEELLYRTSESNGPSEGRHILSRCVDCVPRKFLQHVVSNGLGNERSGGWTVCCFTGYAVLRSFLHNTFFE